MPKVSFVGVAISKFQIIVTFWVLTGK